MPSTGYVADVSPQPGSIMLSVLVAAKDEADSLPRLIDELATALSTSPMIASWEAIVVDDGSADSTWRVLEQLTSTHSTVRGIRLRRNFGKSSALAVALAESHGTLIATIDADLQDDPAEIPAMVGRLIREDVDMVAGFKADRQDPIGKRLPSKIFNAVTSRVTGLSLRDHNCGLKVARREVFESLPIYGEMHRFFAAISHANGFTIVEQPVNHRARQFGHSKFGLERYARGGLDLFTVVTLTRYGRRPAHLFGGLGLLAGSLGLAILVYLSGLWILTDQAIGGRPLLLLGVLLMILSVQLISLGILAELIIARDARRDDPLTRIRSTSPPA